MSRGMLKGDDGERDDGRSACGNGEGGPDADHRDDVPGMARPLRPHQSPGNEVIRPGVHGVMPWLRHGAMQRAAVLTHYSTACTVAKGVLEAPAPWDLLYGVQGRRRSRHPEALLF